MSCILTPFSNLESELKKLLEVEEMLIPSFKKLLVMLINFNFSCRFEEATESIFASLYEEEHKLSLDKFSFSELHYLLKLLPDKDFFDLYFQNELNSQVRLSFQIKKEYLYRLKKKGFKQNLSNTEKKFYYNNLYHFRTIESYFSCHENVSRNGYTIDYFQTFLSLWYSTPGLEDACCMNLNLLNWLVGKNLSLEEYEKLEQHFLIKFFEFFLPSVDEISPASLGIDYIQLFFQTFFHLSNSYWNQETFQLLNKQLVKNPQNQEILKMILKNSF